VLFGVAEEGGVHGEVFGLIVHHCLLFGCVKVFEASLGFVPSEALGVRTAHEALEGEDFASEAAHVAICVLVLFVFPSHVRIGRPFAASIEVKRRAVSAAFFDIEAFYECHLSHPLFDADRRFSRAVGQVIRRSVDAVYEDDSCIVCNRGQGAIENKVE
jgi:hypothetical protein